MTLPPWRRDNEGPAFVAARCGGWDFVVPFAPHRRRWMERSDFEGRVGQRLCGDVVGRQGASCGSGTRELFGLCVLAGEA